MLPSLDASRQSSGDSSPALGGSWLERHVAPFAERVGNAPRVRALREALPISFIGLLLALGFLVFTAKSGTFPERLRGSISEAFAIMSIVLVFVLAQRLAARLNIPYVHTFAGSIFAFGFALPRSAFHSFADFGNVLGRSGLFVAIVACLSAAGAIRLANRRFGEYVGPVVGTLAIWIGSWALYALHISIGSLLAASIAPLATLGDSYLALFVIVGIQAVLWLFGINGPALLAALIYPVYLNLQLVNTEAFSHHQSLPHIVVTSTFLFVFPGGAGATLPLVVFLLRSRVSRLRKFAYAAIVPSIFNINEPVLFGLPLVYNPMFAIPFIGAPLVLVTTTYLAMALHLVRAPVYYVPSSVPVFANVFIATLDWRAVVLVVVNLAIAGAIWYPFVRLYERSEIARAEAAARTAAA